MSFGLVLQLFRNGSWVDCGNASYCLARITELRANIFSRPVAVGELLDVSAGVSVGDRVRAVTTSGRVLLEGRITRLVVREAASAGRWYQFELSDYINWYRNAWVWVRYTTRRPLGELLDEVVGAINRAAGEELVVRVPRDFESVVRVEGEYSGGVLDILYELGKALGVVFQQGFAGGRPALVAVKSRPVVDCPADTISAKVLGFGGVTQYDGSVVGVLARRGKTITQTGRAVRVRTRSATGRTGYLQFAPASDGQCAGLGEPCVSALVNDLVDLGSLRVYIYVASDGGFLPLTVALRRGEVVDGQLRVSDDRFDYVVDVDFWRSTGGRGIRLYVREPLSGYYEERTDEQGRVYYEWVPHYAVVEYSGRREFVVEVPGANEVTLLEDFGEPGDFPNYAHGGVYTVTAPTGNGLLDALLFGGEELGEADVFLIGEGILDGYSLLEKGGGTAAVSGFLVGAVHGYGGSSLGILRELVYSTGGFIARFAPSTYRELDEEVARLKREVRGLRVEVGG